MPKLLNLRFPEGWYFSNFDNTKQIDPLKYIILFSNGIDGRLWVKLVVKETVLLRTQLTGTYFSLQTWEEMMDLRKLRFRFHKTR